MRHLIRRYYRSNRDEIAVSDSEAAAIRTAKRGVLFALELEERFSMIRENYREYEREVFEIAQKSVLYSHAEWPELVEDLYSLNRRLLNVLAACRVYRDHLSRDLRRIFGPTSDVRHGVRLAREHEEAHCLEFEFMEAVRDKIQHALMPVSHSGRQMSRDDRSGGTVMIRHTATPRLSLHELRERGELSAELFAKVLPRSDNGLLLINPWLRDYMRALGRLHFVTRDLIAQNVASWDDAYMRTIEQAKADLEGVYALTLCCEYEDSDDELSLAKPPKDEDLFDDLVKRRRYLEKRSREANTRPSARDYISSE